VGDEPGYRDRNSIDLAQSNNLKALTMNLPLSNGAELGHGGLYILLVIGLITIGLIFLVLKRPQLSRHRIGQSLIFLAFVPLPLLTFVGGLQQHVELSKQTEFCVSCHVMRPYGESLLIDDDTYIPAAHYQNRRVPSDKACFTCHTTYTMYGDWSAKFRGLRHLWVNYIGTVPTKPELYGPYQNRECLHCHAGARSFEENEMHSDDREALTNDETSCLDCHDFTHSTENLCEQPKWEGGSE
jgi:cytochrome c nitrite reductase small subunit